MPKPVRVVPAILTESAQTLEKMIRQSETFTNYVQVDIMDGEFVPSRSVTWEQMKGLNIKLRWEVHLMVKHPESYLEPFKRLGAQKAIFHYEATEARREVISSTRKLGLAVGLAINPETPVSAILTLVNEIDGVLFLSVVPGYYGSKFIPEVLDKVIEFRKAYPHVKTGIDGGIKESNIAQVARSGVNEIFVGSAILQQPDPGESYRRLLSLAQEA